MNDVKPYAFRFCITTSPLWKSCPSRQVAVRSSFSVAISGSSISSFPESATAMISTALCSGSWDQVGKVFSSLYNTHKTVCWSFLKVTEEEVKQVFAIFCRVIGRHIVVILARGQGHVCPSWTPDGHLNALTFVLTLVKFMNSFFPVSYDELYAFSYNPKQNDQQREEGWQLIDLGAEFERMGVPCDQWQLTDVNRDYKVWWEGIRFISQMEMYIWYVSVCLGVRDISQRFIRTHYGQ